MLAAVSFVPGRDRLLPAGDLVNKGPDSEGVLDLLMAVAAEPVLGNHDLHYLQKGKLAAGPRRTWLEQQPYVRMFDDLILVHAGLHPHWDESQLQRLGHDDRHYIVNVRYCDEAGNQPPADWPPPGPPYRPWDDFYRGSKRVVFGHWARRGLVVRPQCVEIGRAHV